MATEQGRVAREKEDVLAEIRRTESVRFSVHGHLIEFLTSAHQDMDDVRYQLQRYKKDNHALEGELRGMHIQIDIWDYHDLQLPL
jgi:hypothetical protein